MFSPYETLSDEPNYFSISLGRPLYTVAAAIPCSAYNCVRQCARVGPPFYDTSAGVNDFGKPSYDVRYIGRIEARPGVLSPIPGDTSAGTTTVTGVLPTMTP